jgi:ABC-type sugar transport system permease subunit
LSNPALVTYSLIAAAVWRQIPYVMVLYIAGLKNVPSDLVEAALVDGASWFQRFRHVIIPMLLPATVIAVTISIIDSLRAFDIVYVMTRGGPFNSSSVMAHQMYTEAFNNYNMGYGAAIAVIQFIITFSFIALYLRRVMKQEEAR